MKNNNPRTARGNGSVRQRENGTWEARCVIDGKRRSFYGERQSDVIKAMRAAKNAEDEGVYFEPKRLTVASWLDTWLDEYIKPSAKPLTHTTYKSRIETHIKPAIGKLRLSSLNATQIQTFYNSLLRERGLSPKSIKNVHGILHRALEQALKLRYIGINPADACTLPRVEKHEIKPLSEDEVTAFLSLIGEGEPLCKLFTVALFTGMREGEICGLPWDAVNFRDGTITVKQQLCRDKARGGSHYIAATKNDKARVLTVPPFIMELLKEIRREQFEYHARMGEAWENEWDLVFTNETGHFIYPQTAFKRFKSAAAKIGRPDARFHDLRHTYAVTALQEGDDVKTVQANLGHATASFTLDVYGHVSEKMKNESAARMQAYFERVKA